MTPLDLVRRMYDKIIVGGGLYGLYAALECGRRGQRVVVIERDDAAFMRATYINQARVHMGYHYPRSLSTALKSAHYFERFVEDFGFCILSDFNQVYATASHFSWTNANEFVRFCSNAQIRCDEVPVSRYFKPHMCDGAFETTEYTYDAHILRDYLLDEIGCIDSIEMRYGILPQSIKAIDDFYWSVKTSDGCTFEAKTIVNTTYAGVNNIHALVGVDPYPIKYELCEIILCEVDEPLNDVGITVMDGPFFSIMPFGKTGLHSLTSVTFTPHLTSYDKQPTFSCQQYSAGKCRPLSLYNCNECAAKPETAWPFMGQLARKYLRDEFGFHYKKSLFSMKPILKASEVDDSRPTVVRVVHESPRMVSALSGKINTVYDLDPYLD